MEFLTSLTSTYETVVQFVWACVGEEMKKYSITIGNAYFIGEPSSAQREVH